MVPTSYRFDIFINDQLQKTAYDTVISVGTGVSTLQFSTTGPC
jgi:hypothetical protein